MAALFPGGIFDTQRGLAFTRLADGEIVAITLSSGTVEWRRSAAGRPIGATDQGLVTIAADGNATRISILDAATGEPRRTIPAPLPPWVADEVNNYDGFCATVAEHDGEIEVSWTARPLYREGAAPPKGRAILAKEFSGRFVIPPDGDRAIERAGSAPTSSAPGSEPSFEMPVEAHHGDRTYSLESVARGPAESAVVLKVRDRRNGSVILEREIKKQPISRPPPLRM